MAKFVKKSDVVEVFRFGDEEEIPKWVSEAVENKIISTEYVQEGEYIKKPILIIKTQKRGLWRGELDDYIIRNSHGEISSCNFELFDDIYQKVEYTVTVENTRNYAENLEQRHRCVDEEKDKKSKLELSAKLELDTTDFEENIKSATKEIEIFNKAADKLEQKINEIFGREKVKEVKINIPTISKSESVEEVNGKLLKELKSQKLIVSEKDKKFKKYDICFKNGECISGAIKEHVADKLTAYFCDSQSDIDCLRAIEDEEKLVMFNTANVQTITISDYIENEEIDYI
ncbi:hypothetical protein Q3209_17685 [Clostridioides difficile]|nr:hypothetical protein [Clostridioides difficile]MDN9545441.1 hypothetical protein [Clostridioides difficile]MDN9830273.1 hypothetical protein [Clostridioides difficile]MDN9926905.1 hypothetical protein [Clostridioides difficile]MDS2181665.1 hypothetical protein [Clostridioides difficile]